MKSQKILLTIGIFILLCTALTAIEVEAKMIRRVIDNALYDNYNHYLPCDELPAVEEVRAALVEHPDAAKAIEAVNPGRAGLEIDDSACAGRADLLIWYSSHKDRQEIERILSDERFFGVPYWLQNR